MLIKKNQIFIFEEEEYSDRMVMGVYRALKRTDLQLLLEKSGIPSFPASYAQGRENRAEFVLWLIKKKYIVSLGATPVINLGCYNQVEIEYREEVGHD